LGGEELKIPLCALLLTAGLLVQISTISAQEETQEISPPLESTYRAAEEIYTMDENTGTVSNASGSSVWAVIRMLLTLALAAAAIYGIVYFLKRSSKKTVNKDPFLKLLATVHLGSNRYAHIISIGGRAWILGSSDGGVNVISEVDNKDVIDAMLLEESRRSAEAPGKLDFVGMLRRLGLPSETKLPGADDIRKRRERIKGL
jgi:flagellar protein FliO/FliZ